MPYWINTNSTLRLAITPRPRGGDWLEFEAQAMRRDQIDILASLLTPEESAELDLVAEASVCAAAGIDFRNFPIPDRQVPESTSAFRDWITELHQQARAGRSIATHCRAGIGRSSLTLAAILSLEGFTAEAAFQGISEARGLKVPDTEEQIEWIRRFRS